MPAEVRGRTKLVYFKTYPFVGLKQTEYIIMRVGFNETLLSSFFLKKMLYKCIMVHSTKNQYINIRDNKQKY